MAKSAKTDNVNETNETSNADIATLLKNQNAVLVALAEAVKNSDSENPNLAKLTDCLEKLTDNTDARRLDAKAERRRRQKSLSHQLHIGKVESALIECEGGQPAYFRVYLSDEPRSARLIAIKSVGNCQADALLAAKKFEAFFGILGYSRTGYVPVTEPLASLPSLDDESAWPKDQRKGILDGRDAEAQLAASAG